MAVLENKIVVGDEDNPIITFHDDTLTDISITQAVALVGQELSIDTLEFTAYYSNPSAVVFAPSDYPSGIYTSDASWFATSDPSGVKDALSIDYGTVVRYYNNNELIAKFYVSEVQRTGKYTYKFSTTSFIGLLDKLYHAGGIYNSMVFSDILSDILTKDDGTAIVSYTVTDDVADLVCSGWLPHDTRRNNLYQLMVANGVNIIKGYDGDPIFTFVYAATPSTVEKVNTYLDGSVTYSTTASEIDITEHDYIYLGTEDEETVFDNSTSASVENEQVWFSNAPIAVDSLTADDGLTFTDATVNGCVVTGQGTLKGQPYSHSKRSVTKELTGWTEEKVVSITDATMVNAINSENLLNRLASYYTSTMEVDMNIKMSEEKCGLTYSITDPFGDQQTAFLESMDINATGFRKADCKFITGYDPSGQKGLYEHCMVLTKETFEESGGVFTVPEGVTSMKVVIIAGGTGGTSGYPGENGEDPPVYTEYEQGKSVQSIYYGAEGGEGGDGGPGGSGGRIRTVVIENPEPTYNYTIGEGGEGGAHTDFIPDTLDELKDAFPDYSDEEIQKMYDAEMSRTTWDGNPNKGTVGTASTFGSYSSSDYGSFVPNAGYYNPLDGKIYATYGGKGVKGGHGGAYETTSGNTSTWTTSGENVSFNGVEYKGGWTPDNINTVEGLPEVKINVYGGNGAGAAVGLDYKDYDYMVGLEPGEPWWETYIEQ